MKRTVKLHNLDVMIAIGYRVNSVIGTSFRQWATKTLWEHITKGFTINRNRIAKNYDIFMEAVRKVRELAPAQGVLANETMKLRPLVDIAIYERGLTLHVVPE